MAFKNVICIYEAYLSQRRLETVQCLYKKLPLLIETAASLAHFEENSNRMQVLHQSYLNIFFSVESFKIFYEMR